LAGWLIENVYDGPYRLASIGVATVGGVLLSLGVVGSIGRDRLHEWVGIMRSLGPAGVLGVLWTAMPPIGGLLLLANIGAISAWLQDHQIMGVVLYMVIFIFSAGFGALPTYSQAILGGWAFGPVTGFAAAWVGFVGASVIGFYIARTVSRDRVEKVIAGNDKAEAIRQALVGHGLARTTLVVTLLRIPPNSPFALTNLVMSTTGVARVPFVIGTALGMAPRTLAAVLLAAAGASRGDDIVQVLSKDPLIAIIGIAITFVVLGIIGFIAKRALEKLSAGPMKPEQGTATPDSD
ncbi:MAG: VTT domain-containing protein, partial [Planctomycetota bacterium]